MGYGEITVRLFLCNKSVLLDTGKSIMELRIGKAKCT